jgi:competence protein ComEC
MFISGILFRICVNVTPPLFIMIVLFILYITLSFIPSFDKNFRIRWIFGAMALLMVFYSGVLLTHFTYTAKNYTQYIICENSVAGIVISLPDEKDNSYELTVKVTHIKQDSQWHKTKGKLIVYLEKHNRVAQLNIGDQILFKSRLQRITNPGNPGEFDYSGYMQRHRIFASTYVPNDAWVKTDSNKGNYLLNLSGQIRKKYINILTEHKMPEEELAIAAALIVGHKDDLTPRLKDSYASAGAMHLLAISGLHVGIIYVILNAVFFFFDKIHYGTILKTIIIIAILGFYAVMTGMSSSVVRAVTMFSILAIGNTFNRHVNVYNTLSISAFFILLFNPLLILEVGFQLSYIAVISIIYFHPKIYSMLSIQNKWLRKIWSLAAVSIAAQIAVFPVVLYYFHQFPVCFLFTNIFAIPLVTVAIYFGVLVFIVSPFYGPASFVIDVFTWNIGLLNKIIGLIHNIPFSTVHSISVDGIQTILLYVMIVVLTGYLIIKKTKYLLGFLACVVLFLTWDMIKIIELDNKRSFYVYNIHGVSACDVLEHKQNLLLYNATDEKEKQMIHTFLSDHWLKHNIRKPSLFTYQQLLEAERALYYPFVQQLRGNAYIRLKDNTAILVLHKNFEKFESPEKLKARYVIIGKSMEPDIEKISNIIEFRQLIFDSSVPFYTLKAWKQQCEKNNINYYSVSEEGAFIHEF